MTTSHSPVAPLIMSLAAADLLIAIEPKKREFPF
jgi:hypothetical protein